MVFLCSTFYFFFREKESGQHAPGEWTWCLNTSFSTFQVKDKLEDDVLNLEKEIAALEAEMDEPSCTETPDQESLTIPDKDINESREATPEIEMIDAKAKSNSSRDGMGSDDPRTNDNLDEGERNRQEVGDTETIDVGQMEAEESANNHAPMEVIFLIWQTK